MYSIDTIICLLYDPNKKIKINLDNMICVNLNKVKPFNFVYFVYFVYIK